MHINKNLIMIDYREPDSFTTTTVTQDQCSGFVGGTENSIKQVEN